MSEGIIIALLGFAGAVLGAAIAGFAGIAKAGIEGKSESRFSCGLVGVLIALGAAVGVALGILIVPPAPLSRLSPTQSQPPNSACVVPAVEGLEQSAAEGLITQLGLRVVKSTQYNLEVAVGAVLLQNPKVGTKLDPCKGDITIVVSLGATPTLAPTTNQIVPVTQTSLSCENVNGTYRRALDKSFMTITQTGCVIIGVINTDHNIEGYWNADGYYSVTIARHVNGCDTKMFGQLFKLSNRDIRVLINGTDATCGLPFSYSEDYVWVRQ